MADGADLVIRGGTIADGRGGDLYEADIAISGGRIVEVGKVSIQGAEEIDAKGKLVTPGFVDVHTHYDGQVTWSNDVTPSSQNGVTTVIMGNCGVGFAPCRPADHGRLIELMEGVEDIPEPVLSAGIPWEWESFPEFVGWLSKRSYDVDVGALLPHAAVRVYVMDERGARREPATAEDSKAMAAIAADAIRAGALGFSTSRTINHRTSTGDFTPTLKAGEDELAAIANAMRAAGPSYLQFVLDNDSVVEDLPMMLRVAENTRCPISFLVTQHPRSPERYRETLDQLAKANAKGIQVTAQVAARAVGLLLGLELSRHPFQTLPSYKAIAHLPLAERVRRMHDPAVRAAILSEQPEKTSDPLFSRPNYDWTFLLGDPPDYEQPRENSLSARAAREGKRPQELAYDAMLEDEGRGMLYVPGTNYAGGNLDAVYDMLSDPSAVPGLSDGGAHCGIICDASFPTFLLTHWTRDRKRGEKLSIPFVVEAQARRTAELVGLHDRGVLARGYKADINVIDYDRLHLHPPQVHYDLPKGGRRLVQQIDGYDATIVSGVVSRRQGQSTGARSGRLIRGVQSAPVAQAAE
jgi:N-acyl-D-aspartate/D-glutamate deacylase